VQPMTRNLGISSVLCLVLLPRVAYADLTGAFADALDIDTEFVTGVSGATDIAFAPDGRAVVTQKDGQITVRRSDGTKNVVTGAFMNVDTGSEKGLLGVVAHPTEANTFFFYVSDGESSDDKHRVYAGTLTENDSVTIDLDDPIVAASLGNGPGLEGPANHDGGGLFVHDGHLFIGVGDTGSNATPPQNKYSSCLNKPNGKILRVALDGSIPSDNPFVGADDVTACDSVRGDWGTDAADERVYAWGFRNPWRFWIDPHSNRMWIGDVGEVTREEISVSSPTGAGWTGEHFGYPFVEGTEDYGELDGVSCDDGLAPERACTPPVHDYDNDSEGNCVIGGIIPDGSCWEGAFDGKLYYFFADNGNAWIRALEVKPDRSGVVSSTAVNVGTFSGSGPVSFRQGPGGAMYVVMNRGNAVYELKPKAQTGDDCQSTGGTGGAGGTGSGGAAGRGGSGNAGTPGSGGAAAGAAGSSAGDNSPDDEGCGCRVAGKREGSLAALLAALGLAGSVFARRRVRSRRSPG
jgi:MYXO-CTERM domain-containing protein